MTYTLYTDGGARGNPGPGGAGAVITNEDNKVVYEASKYLGVCTNNEAEYLALILGLTAAAEKKLTKLTCYLDSELVVRQLNGQYKVKNDRLKKLFDAVLALKFQFTTLTFVHVVRSKNARADELVNEAIDKAVA